MTRGKQFSLEMSDTESVGTKKRKMEQELPSSSGGENQGSILGKVIKELGDIEAETPNTLELILLKKQTGVSDLEVGNQIVEYLQSTSLKLKEITNRGYHQVQKSDQNEGNREQALIFWRNVCNQVMQTLKTMMGNYFEQKLTLMERSIVQQITEGSSNFRNEIEGRLSNADNTFNKMNNDVRNAMNQVAIRFSENEEKNEKLEGMLKALMEQTQQTQQVLVQERRERKRTRKQGC